MARAAATTMTVDGHDVALTNAAKVMYPATGTTKADVAGYYRAVSPWFVAHNGARPATRKRWVDGVGTAEHPGKAFFSKDIDAGTPAWVATAALTHRDRDAVYPLVDDAATLVWLAQIAALEIHVPQWRIGPDGAHLNPDRLVLDLDPGEGVGLAECARVAHLCREILDGMGLPSVPVTSGSKGIHLYAALDGHTTADQATLVARELARSLEAGHPDLIVSDMKRALRGGKVFLDWSQNNGHKTTVAPYSLRGRARPFVAAPRTWEELDADLGQLEFPEVLDRLERLGDPMEVLLGEQGAAEDRLEKYRSMRDAAQTPEPVPAQRRPKPPADEECAGPPVGHGNSFVIQEHHARRLHWDFRLERDGVLVSWALPKGPPTDPKKNHLAVMTEDHPLEYGSFEGTIPAGQYGAGAVTIWDSGTYDTQKWVDGREVIAVLHGRPGGGLGGSARFALIRTGRGDERNWLIHRMADPRDDVERLPRIEPMLATPGSAADLLGGQWVYETKWDGYRAIASVAGGRAVLRSRGGLDVTAAYPELAELAEVLAGRAAVLDGEIVALDGEGRTSFERLQNRGEASSRTRVHYMVFDLLHLDGRSLLRTPYAERRRALESLGIDGGHVHVPVTFGSDRDLALRTTRELRLEGLIAKAKDSIYRPGARSRTWLKIKYVHTQEVIVVGWTPGSGRRGATLGSLLLAVHTDDGLRYAGKVGTGFTEKSLAAIRRELAAIERPTAPLDGVPGAEARDARWVEPSRVGEVTYGEWTSAGRLRHPVWRGWRPDKSPQEARRTDG